MQIVQTRVKQRLAHLQNMLKTVAISTPIHIPVHKTVPNCTLAVTLNSEVSKWF